MDVHLCVTCLDLLQPFAMGTDEVRAYMEKTEKGKGGSEGERKGRKRGLAWLGDESGWEHIEWFISLSKHIKLNEAPYLSIYRMIFPIKATDPPTLKVPDCQAANA